MDDPAKLDLLRDALTAARDLIEEEIANLQFSDDPALQPIIQRFRAALRKADRALADCK
jgi:hypothetical protein